MSHGLIIGKFMPPTMGHQYLIDFGREMCPITHWDVDGYPTDGLSVFIGYHPNDPISGKLRTKALDEHYGSTVRNIYDGQNTLPDSPPEDEFGINRFWRDWVNLITMVTGRDTFDYVFGSEQYCNRLAAEFKAQFIPVNTGRRTVQISASIVRNSVMFNWDYILPEFRHNFVKRVAVVGPESCGKTELCRDLARYFKTEWCPEWARAYLENDGNRYPIEADYPLIVKAHAVAEDTLMRQANRVLICDTDAVATKIAAKLLNIFEDPIVNDYCKARKYDLTILMRDDVPYIPDPLRYGITKRQLHFSEFVKEYDNLGTKYIVADGSWENRFQTAAMAITKLLNVQVL